MRITQSKKQKRSPKSHKVYLVPLYYQVGKRRKYGGKAIMSSEPLLQSNEIRRAKVTSYWGDRLIGLIIKTGTTGYRNVSLEDYMDRSNPPFRYSSIVDDLKPLNADHVSRTTKVIIEFDDAWVKWAYGVHIET